MHVIINLCLMIAIEAQYDSVPNAALANAGCRNEQEAVSEQESHLMCFSVSRTGFLPPTLFSGAVPILSGTVVQKYIYLFNFDYV